MYAHPTQDKLTIAWLNSLTPKEVEIERSGETFSISKNKPTITGVVNARWVNEAKLECDVTALIPQYIRDSFGENSLGMCENVAGGSVVERCVSYGKYNVIITQTYTIGSIPEAGTVMWQNTMLGQCDFFLTVIIPQRIELMSESEYSQSEDHVNDNKTVYMLYPDA